MSLDSGENSYGERRYIWEGGIVSKMNSEEETVLQGGCQCLCLCLLSGSPENVTVGVARRPPFQILMFIFSLLYYLNIEVS